MDRASPHFLLLAMFFLGTGSVESKTYPCQGETHYFEHGSKLEVNCNSTIANFIAAFWYRENTDTDPFLRLENGLKTTPEGYDITANGAMVIEKLRIEHDGFYVTRVIDNLGTSHDMTITIYVKVFLSTEPRIEQCVSSKNDICKSVEEARRQSTFLCIAGEARPAVNITWSTLGGEHITTNYKSASNISSGMFTSTSLVEYDPKTFDLDYITCRVSGVSVNDSTSIGIYVNGFRRITHSQGIQHIKSGSELRIDCPGFKHFQLAQWEITYANKTKRILWWTYPDHTEGPCHDSDRCHVLENATLSLKEVTYKDEGFYACFLRNGLSEKNVGINVNVYVPPVPNATVIKGCEDKINCQLNVANKGTLECFIYGSRPSVRPAISVNKIVTNADVFLFDEEYSEVEDFGSGTFDTMLSIDFDITECSGDIVRLDCQPEDNVINDVITTTTVQLITATGKCDEEKSGKPGLVVFIILFILIIIGAVVFMIIKRKFVLRTITQLRMGYQKAPQGDPDGTPQDETTVEIDQNKHVQVSTPEENIEPKKTLQDVFNDAFKPIFKGIIENETKPEEFEKMMTSFGKDNKVTNPLSYLPQFLQASDISTTDKDIFAALLFILHNLPKQWIVFFLKMLDDLLDENHVFSANYISLIGESYKKRMIEMSRFVEMTGLLLKGKIVSVVKNVSF